MPKVCKNMHFDVMWRHMTSERQIFKKISGTIFWTFVFMLTKFEIKPMHMEEMTGDSKWALKTSLWRHSDVIMRSDMNFWYFSKIFVIFDVWIAFRQKFIIFMDFKRGGHYGPLPCQRFQKKPTSGRVKDIVKTIYFQVSVFCYFRPCKLLRHQ